VYPGIAENEEPANDVIITRHIVRYVHLAPTILDEHGKPEGQWKVSRPSHELCRKADGVLQIVKMVRREVDGVPV
jgi:sigma54-dependent transcription regulator